MPDVAAVVVATPVTLVVAVVVPTTLLPAEPPLPLVPEEAVLDVERPPSEIASPAQPADRTQTAVDQVHRQRGFVMRQSYRVLGRWKAMMSVEEARSTR